MTGRQDGGSIVTLVGSMSLTSQLSMARSPVRRFCDRHFLHDRSRALVRDVNDQVVQQGDKLELLIPPDPRVIGTALSYRLALLWTGDIATTPAGMGRELIPQLAKYATLFSTNRVRQKRLLLDAGDRLWTRITELCAHPSLRLQAAPALRDDMAACRASMGLARFDQLCRTGASPLLDPEVFERSPLAAALRCMAEGKEDAAWEALGADEKTSKLLGSMVTWFRGSSSMWVHPRTRIFPMFAGSNLVGGADGDLLIADMLVEVKCSWRPRPLGRHHVLQLLAYVLLDFDDALAIHDVGFIVPTRGARLLASVGDMLGFLSGARRSLSEWRAMFRTALERQVTPSAGFQAKRHAGRAHVTG